MPDTDVCSVVMPSETTKIPQAIHLKHFKALSVSFKGRPSLTTIKQN